MSMWLSLVRVTPSALEALKKDPDLLQGVLFDEDDKVMKQLGIAKADVAGCDFRSAHEMFEAMAEVDGEEASETSVQEDLGADGELGYEAGYGPAFTISPEAIKAT